MEMDNNYAIGTLMSEINRLYILLNILAFERADPRELRPIYKIVAELEKAIEILRKEWK